MEEGVILENPSTITIEKGVEIGKDTKIESNVKILGKTKIGEDCLIGSGSQVEDSTLGNNIIVILTMTYHGNIANTKREK